MYGPYMHKFTISDIYGCIHVKLKAWDFSSDTRVCLVNIVCCNMIWIMYYQVLLPDFLGCLLLWWVQTRCLWKVPQNSLHWFSKTRSRSPIKQTWSNMEVIKMRNQIIISGKVSGQLATLPTRHMTDLPYLSGQVTTVFSSTCHTLVVNSPLVWNPNSIKFDKFFFMKKSRISFLEIFCIFRESHYPPETASISLICRMIAMVMQVCRQFVIS